MGVKAKLDKVQKQMHRLRDQMDKLQRQDFVERILPKAKKHIGKAYKYLNSGGRFDTVWWHFVKIIGVSEKSGEFVVIKLDIYPDDSCKIEFKDRAWNHDGGSPCEAAGYIPIDAETFDEIWNEQLEIMRVKT